MSNLSALPANSTPTVSGKPLRVEWLQWFNAIQQTLQGGLFNGIVDNGNLTFTGVGRRIYGDTSNATLANRVMFQTSTVNGNSTVCVIPNGISTASAFVAFNASDPGNSSWSAFHSIATETRIEAGFTGTGTYLPMTLFVGGLERLRIDTAGNLTLASGSLNLPSGNIVLASASPYTPQINLNNSANDTTASYIFLNKKRGASSAVTIGDGLGTIGWSGWDGTQMVTSNYLACGVGAAVSAGVMPGLISVTVNNAQRAFWDHLGNYGINITPAATTGWLQVYGGVYGGAPQSSGSTDANQLVYFRGGGGQTRFGIYNSADGWIQQSSAGNYATNYALALNPNGGDVFLGPRTAIATNAIVGFPTIPTCAGIPTGVPANASINGAQLVCDSTNFKMYAYINGAWRILN